LLALRRVQKRNVATDEYKRCMDDVRARFRALNPSGSLNGYMPFAGGPDAVRRVGVGGLTDLVAAVNSLIGGAGLAAALFAASGSLAATGVAAVLGFAVSAVGHIRYLARSSPLPAPADHAAMSVGDARVSGADRG
jgi:hypothetical protein